MLVQPFLKLLANLPVKMTATATSEDSSVSTDEDGELEDKATIGLLANLHYPSMCIVV